MIYFKISKPTIMACKKKYTELVTDKFEEPFTLYNKIIVKI